MANDVGSDPTGGDLGFSYELAIELDLDFPAGSGTPDWAQLGFITNVQPALTRQMQETTTYKNKGAKAQAVTGDDWQITFDYQIQRAEDGTYVDTLQALVDAAKPGKRNDDAKVSVRIYDTEGADYAFSGEAYVALSRTNTGNTDVGAYTVTLTGDGKLTPIANPAIDTP